jgi:hypothetical protein
MYQLTIEAKDRSTGKSITNVGFTRVFDSEQSAKEVAENYVSRLRSWFSDPVYGDVEFTTTVVSIEVAAP